MYFVGIEVVIDGSRRLLINDPSDKIMHFTMLSPWVGGGGRGEGAMHGKLTERAFPWEGVLTFNVALGLGI